MSFTRSKPFRSTKLENKIEKEPFKSLAKSGSKQGKWTRDNTKSIPSNHSTNHRSASQPSSSINLTKPLFRPHSGGDENQLCKIEKDDGIEFQMKASTDNTSKQGEYVQGLDSDRDSRMHPIKTSPSGIPLRIKSTSSSRTLPRKIPSPRVIKQSSNIVPPSRPHEVKVSPASRRVMETQFQNKKKKMEVLKKELLDKQKPLLEIYQALLQMKKKLELDGKSKIVLEELKVVNFKEAKDARHSPNGSVTGDDEDGKKKLDPEIVKVMRDTIKQIPTSLLDICKIMMTKRVALLGLLQKMTLGPIKSDELQHHIHSLKEESSNLESMLEQTFSDQEKRVSDLVDKWEILLQTNGDVSGFTDQIEQLQDKMKHKDKKLSEVNSELKEIRRKIQEENVNTEVASSMLNDKIKALQHDQSQDKTTIQEQKEKNNMLEQKMKTIKCRAKEYESKNKEMDGKYTDLQKQHKIALEQLKTNEIRWSKEKEEMINKHKHDRQMLDKLTKDRSYFETRVKTLEELAAEWEVKYNGLVETSREEVEEVRNLMLEEKVARETMEAKYEGIKEEMVQLEVQSKQALDIFNTKKLFIPNEGGITTEREAELYTELLATRVALKSAEEHIQNYNREKMRFIDSIQTLQNDDRDQDLVAKTLLKNVEMMSQLEAQLVESEEIICNQKIEIANLKVDSEHFKQISTIKFSEIEPERLSVESDLKMMLHEGRMKLEQSLKKSLDYEHKIIRYEHALNKQGKQICEMENLLKVRDGLISMMKAKKDELQMENDSLNKYGNEIRDLLLQAKEEARNRTELVKELSTNLNLREQVCHKLEKKVQDLQESLTVTNEKRFKLQDTLGSMEKELQTTKTQLTKLAPELQTRYGIDMSNFSNTSNEQKVTESTLTKQINPNFGDSPNFIPLPSLANCQNKSFQNATKQRTSNHKNPYTSLEDIEKAFNAFNLSIESSPDSVISDEVTKEFYVNRFVNEAQNCESSASNMFDSCSSIDRAEKPRKLEANQTILQFREMVDNRSNQVETNYNPSPLVSNKKTPNNTKSSASSINSKIPELSSLKSKRTHDKPITAKSFPLGRPRSKHKVVTSKRSKLFSCKSSSEKVAEKSAEKTASKSTSDEAHKFRNEYIAGHTKQHARYPLEMYMRCHHSAILSQANSSQGKPRPNLPKSPRVDPKTQASSRTRPCRQKPNPKEIGDERTTFITHTRNISRHMSDQRHQSQNNAELQNTKSLVKPSTVMEVRNRDLLTRSLSKIKADLAKSIKILSQNLLKPNSSKLKTADSLPYL